MSLHSKNKTQDKWLGSFSTERFLTFIVLTYVPKAAMAAAPAACTRKRWHSAHCTYPSATTHVLLRVEATAPEQPEDVKDILQS